MADAPQTMPPSDPLAQLRDIHLPPPPESWPPAPGWWLLALIAVLAVGFAAALALRYWQRNRYRREAVREAAKLYAKWTTDGDSIAYVAAVQTLLKRVALSAFPRAEVARLTGEAWVAFLDRTMGSHEFSMGAGEVLIDAHYRRNVSIDAARLNALTCDWIARHDPQRTGDAHERAGLREPEAA